MILVIEEEVDFLLRNLPGLQVLNGLVVERDAIFSEDEGDGSNTDRQPLSNTINVKEELEGTNTEFEGASETI